MTINGGTPISVYMVDFMENPIKMDDLGVALFEETTKCVTKCVANVSLSISLVPMFFLNSCIPGCANTLRSLDVAMLFVGM